MPWWQKYSLILCIIIRNLFLFGCMSTRLIMMKKKNCKYSFSNLLVSTMPRFENMSHGFFPFEKSFPAPATFKEFDHGVFHGGYFAEFNNPVDQPDFSSLWTRQFATVKPSWCNTRLLRLSLKSSNFWRTRSQIFSPPWARTWGIRHTRRRPLVRSRTQNCASLRLWTSHRWRASRHATAATATRRFWKWVQMI